MNFHFLILAGVPPGVTKVTSRCPGTRATSAALRQQPATLWFKTLHRTSQFSNICDQKLPQPCSKSLTATITKNDISIFVLFNELFRSVTL